MKFLYISKDSGPYFLLELFDRMIPNLNNSESGLAVGMNHYSGSSHQGDDVHQLQLMPLIYDNTLPTYADIGAAISY